MKRKTSAIIPCEYVLAKDFSEGLAAVERSYLFWGFIDKTGKVVIPYNYDRVKSFSEGLAAVKLNGKWGFIDKTGKVVIPFKFQRAESFSEGLAAVKFKGNRVFIDKTWQDTTSSIVDIKGVTDFKGLCLETELGINLTSTIFVGFSYNYHKGFGNYFKNSPWQHTFFTRFGFNFGK